MHKAISSGLTPLTSQGLKGQETGGKALESLKLNMITTYLQSTHVHEFESLYEHDLQSTLTTLLIYIYYIIYILLLILLLLIMYDLYIYYHYYYHLYYYYYLCDY